MSTQPTNSTTPATRDPNRRSDGTFVKGNTTRLGKKNRKSVRVNTIKEVRQLRKRMLARLKEGEAIEKILDRLISIATDPYTADPRTAIEASKLLLEQGLGRPPEAVDISVDIESIVRRLEEHQTKVVANLADGDQRAEAIRSELAKLNSGGES